MRTEDTHQDRYIVPGLVRGLKILQLFTAEKPYLGISDMARELGITRSTALRLAYTLESLGFLERGEHSKKYQLSLKVLDIGFRVLAGLDVVDLSRQHLRELSVETSASAHLAVLDGREIVYVARFSGQQHIGSTVGVGTRFPAHATSSGRVLLSDLPARRIVELYEGVPLDPATEQTATTLGDLIDLLAEDRERGYVLSWGAYEKSLASIAAPLRDDSRRVVASINITCPMGLYTREEFSTTVRDKVLEKARSISAALGGRP